MGKTFTSIKDMFAFDVRALGLLRIGIATLVIVDLFIRTSDLKAFYSDEGLLPLNLLFQHSWTQYNFSFHTTSGLWQVQALIFAINALFAILMLLGYKTRWSTFACWLLMLSLHNRNPLILQGGDDLFRMVLFWGIFLPWGKAYSIDAYHKPPEAIKKVCNLGTIGYLLQILSVYFFAALLKTSAEWRTDGTALYFALSIDQMVFPLGKLIYPYPNLLKILTHATWYLELVAPLLFLVPFKHYFCRKAGIILIASLHLGISLTLFVGLFYLIGIISLLGTLPPDWARAFDQKIKGIKQKVENLYHSVYWLKSNLLRINFGVESPLKIHWLKPVANFALVLVIGYTFVYNWYTLEIPYITKEGVQKIGWFGNTFKFNQKWGMFSPGVFKDDGWYIYEAVTLEGDTIDINRNGLPLDYHKPKHAVSLFKNDRWRKYGENLIFVNNAYLRPQLAEYLLRKWNNENPKRQIKELNVVYMLETTLPDYQYSEPKKEELAKISK